MNPVVIRDVLVLPPRGKRERKGLSSLRRRMNIPKKTTSNRPRTPVKACARAIISAR